MHEPTRTATRISSPGGSRDPGRLERLAWALALVLVSVACGPLDLGGQTGTEGTTGGDDRCKPVATAIERGDASALGFSADDVLAFAEGTHTAELAWTTPSRMDVFGATLSFGPEAGQGSIELSIDRVAGAVHRVHFVPEEPVVGSPEIVPPECPEDRLEIPVRVSLSTGGGALRETLDVPLTASHPLLASFTKELPFAELAGALAVTLEDTSNAQGNLKVAPLIIEASVGPGFTTGTLSSAVELESSGAAGITRVTFGHWPADDPCWLGPASPAGLGGVPVPLDAEFAGVLPSESLARVQSDPLRNLVWSDASSTELSLSVQPSGATGCALLGAEPGSADVPPSVRVPVELQATTSDGRVSSILPGSLVIPIPGEGTSAELTLSGELTCDAGEAVLSSAECGISEVDMGDSTALRVNLTASLDPAISTGGPSGTLTLLSATVPECPPPEEVPPGSAAPGCAGWVWTPIVTGTFTDP